MDLPLPAIYSEVLLVHEQVREPHVNLLVQRIPKGT